VEGRINEDVWPVAVARVTNDPDGKPEILWQHATDKMLEYWHMGWNVRGNPPVPELVRAYDGPLQPSLPPAEDGVWWDLAATGDFDGDGRDDLLFHNTVTRKVAVWFMRNGTRRTNRAIPLSPDTFDRYRPDGSVIPWSIIAPR